MIRVIVIGMGPIGIACARAVLDEAHLQLVGLLDVDPKKVGKTLDQCDEQADPDDEPCHLRITSSLDEAIGAGDAKADVAILTTTSRFDLAAPMILDLLSRGLHVISSCEQMSWPWYRHEDLARHIDAQARLAGRVVLGTGVNPGFIMDSLAVSLTAVVRRVSAVRCTRRVQAGTRRKALQSKIGATLRVERFNELKAAGKIGHVGLPESVAMLGAGLGLRIAPGTIVETLEPVIADQPTPSAMGLIEPGMVAGIHNTASWQDQGVLLSLDLWMAVGLNDPKDVIEIEGPVQLRMKIPGSIPGDSATVAILVNTLLNLASIQPGLRTMLDVPPSGCRGRDRD